MGPGRLRPSVLGSPPEAMGRAELRRGHKAHAQPSLPPAPDLHRQGAVHHLLHLGHLGALQHALQGHRHPAGVLQPDYRDGSRPPARARPSAAHVPGSLNTGRDVGTGTSGPGWGGPVTGHPDFSQDRAVPARPAPCRREGSPSTPRLGRSLWGRPVSHRASCFLSFFLFTDPHRPAGRPGQGMTGRVRETARSPENHPALGRQAGT